MSRRIGFTLIEILIALSIVAVIAAIVLPRALDAAGLGKPAVMAANVRMVRQMIEYRAALSPYGYPDEVDPIWFPTGQLPNHPWTGRPIVIRVVDGALNENLPQSAVFDKGDPDAPTAWYNRTNGAFCALVPMRDNPDEDRALFREVNDLTDAAPVQ